MKRHVKFELRRSEDTSVWVEFDDRDYDPGSIKDMAALGAFAGRVISEDSQRNKPRYEFGNEQIDCVGDLPKPIPVGHHGHASSEECERAPKPQGWLERRVRKALEGYVDPLAPTSAAFGKCALEFTATGTQCVRALYFGATRTQVDGRLDFDGVIDEDGNLVPSADLAKDAGELQDVFKARRLAETKDVLVSAVHRVLGPDWERAETWERFAAAFDWDRDGQVRG